MHNFNFSSILLGIVFIITIFVLYKNVLNWFYLVLKRVGSHCTHHAQKFS